MKSAKEVREITETAKMKSSERYTAYEASICSEIIKAAEKGDDHLRINFDYEVYTNVLPALVNTLLSQEYKCEVYTNEDLIFGGMTGSLIISW